MSVGMTLEQASAAAGTAIRVISPAVRPPECFYAWADTGPAGLRFMVNGDRIVRVDVSRSYPDPTPPAIATLSGVRVGNTEAEVNATYPGRITVQGHPYLERGHYLVYAPADPPSRAFGLIFETDGERVTSFRSGFAEQVTWTEGCG